MIDAAGVGLCVVASLAVYALGVAPLLEQKAFVVSGHRQLQAEREKCAALEASAMALESQLATAQARLAEGQIRLEPSSRTNERVAALAGLLGDHGLEIDDVQIGDVLPSTRCRVVPISIAGRGAYERSVALLHELIRTFGDTSLAKLELVGDAGASGQSPKYRLEMLWYTSPEPSASASSSGGPAGGEASGPGAYRL